MAKSSKGNRPNLSNASPRSYSNLARKSQVDEATPTPVVTESRTTTSDTVNWGHEYGQVFADLRQLLIVSVVLAGLMLALGYTL